MSLAIGGNSSYTSYATPGLENKRLGRLTGKYKKPNSTRHEFEVGTLSITVQLLILHAN